MGAASLVVAAPQLARGSTTNKRLGLVYYPVSDEVTEETTFGDADVYKLIALTKIISHEMLVGSSWQDATSDSPTKYSKKFRGTVHMSVQMQEKVNGSYTNIGGAVDCGYSWIAKIVSDTSFMITWDGVDADGVDGPHGADSTGLILALNPKPGNPVVFQTGGGISASAVCKAGYRDTGSGNLSFKLTWQSPGIPTLEITAPTGSTAVSVDVTVPGLSVSYYVSTPPST